MNSASAMCSKVRCAKRGDRVRITGQLIDASSGTHLWADRFDGSLEDVFELQDKVAIERRRRHRAGIAGRRDRPFGQPPDQRSHRLRSLSARAMRWSWSSARQIPEALRLMEQAIARDPRYGPALAWAAFCCFRLHRDGRSEDPESGPPQGHRFRQASPGSGRRRPGHPGECRLSAGLFRRGHRRDDWRWSTVPWRSTRISRAAGTCSGVLRILGGPARPRDRACRDLAAPQPPRPRRHVASRNRRRAFPQSAFR